jgi:hypothetical protein
MEGLVAEFLEGMVLGEGRSYGGITAFPLHHPRKGGPRYLSLQAALEQGLLEVGEKNAGGSVPELMVANRAERPVLMLDGEELVGAKQNRVLNATILVAAGAEMVIPVSCTEAGRWSYRSARFEASPYVMPRRARRDKTASVQSNLEMGLGFLSDQREVWENVDRMSTVLQAASPTQAMREIIDSRQEDLRGFLDSLNPVPGQKGLLVFLGREPVGLDILSREDAYRQLHPKLMRSYAVDVLLEEKGSGGEAPGFTEAKGFLEELLSCGEERYKSPGLGWDHRFKAPRALGSALVWRRRVVHAAFFRTEARAERGDFHVGDRISDFRSRRRFREF